MEELGVEIMVYPRYSPDFASCGFCWYPEFKEELKGGRFESDLEFNNAVIGIGTKQIIKKWFLTGL